MKPIYRIGRDWLVFQMCRFQHEFIRHMKKTAPKKDKIKLQKPTLEKQRYINYLTKKSK